MNKYKIIIILFLTIITSMGRIFSKENSPSKNTDGKNAIILCFHDINGTGKYSISEEEFNQILNLLDKFEVISLETWYKKVHENFTFKKKPVILTFDDGYESVFNIVVPSLKKRGYGATFFLYTNRYYDASSIYREAGKLPAEFEIGSHSFSHANMLELFEKKPDLFFKEIFLSRKKLGFLVGREIISWAWPYGYYNPEMEKMARFAGYEIQVNTDYKTTRDEWGTSSFSRFTVQNPDPVQQVKEILEKNNYLQILTDSRPQGKNSP